VTKNVGMIKDAIIYDRSILKFFKDAVMGEHDALQTSTSLSLPLNLRVRLLCLYLFAYLSSPLLK